MNGNPQGTASGRAAGETMCVLSFLFKSAFVGVGGSRVSVGVHVWRSKDSLECWSLLPTLLETGSRLLLYTSV